ncbi:MAG: tRNA (adenosine(37)-N6)-dimethylallyltransferase MiaA [Clostridia bacterium]|nr:tRNA (adenosine(37)-N6)-dimethylallyltransferase MiaA [Clostridia bacterium]
MKKTIYVVIGPTASGKTDYSVHLAKKLGGEVISCDSMQIYKRMSIGTAKPTEEEMDGVPHHLIDFVEPTEDFSVNTYRELALPLLEKIETPVICGGTGMWISSLFSGFSEAPAADSALRASYIAMADQGEDLFSLLQKKDPEAAARLHPNDQKRIIRALEVFDLSGRSILDFEAKSKEAAPPYTPHYIFMARSRDELYHRIDHRVDLMMERGLLEEAAPILRDIPSDATALQGIGYKEFRPYFENTASLESCIDTLKQNTRRYAKRQLTWFRRIPVHEIICS